MVRISVWAKREPMQLRGPGRVTGCARVSPPYDIRRSGGFVGTDPNARVCARAPLEKGKYDAFWTSLTWALSSHRSGRNTCGSGKTVGSVC